MPERFEIYIVYKRRYINALPFLIYLLIVESKCIRWLHRMLLPSCMPTRKTDVSTDRRTDGRTVDRYITLSARRGQRGNLNCSL